MDAKVAQMNEFTPVPEDDGEVRNRVYSAPALEKGLDILELLSTQEVGLTRRDIAGRLGRSVSEVFRMVECLVRRSYLVQSGDTYMLGMKLFELAHEFPPMYRLLKEALPRMEALSKTVDQSCHLTVLSGPRQIVVAQVDTPGGLGFSAKIGAEIDILKSASGRVLLAFQSAEESLRLITLAGPQLEASDQKTFTKSISKVATQGYALMMSKQFAGLEAISYPILDLHSYAIAALTVPYVARLDDPTRKPVSHAQAALAHAAADLTVALGGVLGGSAGPSNAKVARKR